MNTEVELTTGHVTDMNLYIYQILYISNTNQGEKDIAL